MKIEILLPTEYINNNLGLSKLDTKLVDKVKKDLISKLLEYEGGVTCNRVEGWYKSRKGIVTKSTYISCWVYTQNNSLLAFLQSSGYISNICKILKQESIGAVIDNHFMCIS